MINNMSIMFEEDESMNCYKSNANMTQDFKIKLKDLEERQNNLNENELKELAYMKENMTNEYQQDIEK